jgi:menaquinone-dependent protoporphyrinogen IX oxidase
MGGIPWSPKLQGFRNAIEVCSMILQKQKGVKVSNTRIHRFMAKTGIWNAFLANGMGGKMNAKTVEWPTANGWP